jgi:hypothetical protein
MELRKSSAFLSLPIFAWAITLAYSTWLFINLFDMPNMYSAELFAGDAVVALLLTNIFMLCGLLISLSAYPELKRKILLRCILLISNLPVVWVYVYILGLYIKY